MRCLSSLMGCTKAEFYCSSVFRRSAIVLVVVAIACRARLSLRAGFEVRGHCSSDSAAFLQIHPSRHRAVVLLQRQVLLLSQGGCQSAAGRVSVPAVAMTSLRSTSHGTRGPQA